MVERPIRLLTLNVAGFDLEWFGWRRDAIVRALKDLAPDILCLQEAATMDPNLSQADDLGQELGLPHAAFAPYGGPYGEPDRVDGVATLSRWSISRSSTDILPLSAEHAGPGRVALTTRIARALSSGPLDVVNVHLSWDREGAAIRDRQAAALLAPGVPASPAAPRVICGDLNAPPYEPCIARLLTIYRDAFASCWPGAPGFTRTKVNGWNHDMTRPDRRIDYVLCGPGVTPMAAAVVMSQGDPHPPSDHFGVLVELSVGAR